MPNSKKTLFISDLHLEENRPDITAIFLKLLKNCDSGVDRLYILGDLFETWIGDDDDAPFHRSIIQALHAATANGLAIYLMVGNRDFLIGKKFLAETGCLLLPDETKIDLYGTPVLLMHGDTLCTQDVAYLKWRRITTNPLVRAFFLFLPLSIRRNIAAKARTKSAAHTHSANLEIMDVTQAEVERVMQVHNVKVLIHGHTHRPAFYEFMLDGHPATRIVLDAWHEHGSVLIWNDDGTKKLVYL